MVLICFHEKYRVAEVLHDDRSFDRLVMGSSHIYIYIYIYIFIHIINTYKGVCVCVHLYV